MNYLFVLTTYNNYFVVFGNNKKYNYLKICVFIYFMVILEN